jgi:hypothetical protein
MEEAMMAARTLVLIDPSSPDGEGGIGELTSDDRAVSLMLTLDGRSAQPLREFADCAEIDVSVAGLIYLDQVIARAGLGTDDVETISTYGTDALAEIIHVLGQRPVHRVIVASSLPGLGREGLAKLIRLCPVPVVVAPDPGDHDTPRPRRRLFPIAS